MLSKWKLYFIYYLMFFPLIYLIHYYFNGKEAVFYRIPSNIMVLAFVSFIGIVIFGKKWVLFKQIKYSKTVLAIILILLALFAVNNYFMNEYGNIIIWKERYKSISVAYVVSTR